MKNLYIFLVMLSFCTAFRAADYSVDTLNITSEVLGEDREILIFTPLELSKSDSIQLLYLVDGEFAEYRYRKALDYSNDKNIIGIGIVNTDRRRDILYANAAGKFLEFIADELIPGMEKKYSVKNKILFGHSFGGSFTLFTMLSRPGLFDKYIASSPTPIMDMVDSKLYLQLNSELDHETSFYFSHGSKDMRQVRKWSERLYTKLLELSLDRIKWKYEVFIRENHNTCDVISLKNGLLD